MFYDAHVSTVVHTVFFNKVNIEDACLNFFFIEKGARTKKD